MPRSESHGAERAPFPVAARVIALLAALGWLLIGIGLGGLLCG